MLTKEKRKEINFLKRAFKKDGGAKFPIYDDDAEFKLPEKLRKKIEKKKKE